MRAPLLLALASLLAAAPGGLAAQSLAERVARAPADAAVAFSFPARDGVCGGAHFVRFGTTVHVSRGSYIYTGEAESHPCQAGPVRVTLLRAGTQIVGLEVGVGPDDSGRTAADLGSVAGSAAAEYLLGLARTMDGRPGQAAIFPAMLVDGVDNSAALEALARHRDLARATRQSAISWLARDLGLLNADRREARVAMLVRLARDADEAPAIRQSAMNALGRGGQGAGVPALIELAGDAEPWVARTATGALAGSGDPRARAHLRRVVTAGILDEATRTAAIRGLGQSYATAQDLAVLREIFPTLTSSRERDAVLAAIGSAGGAEHARWLLGVARDPAQPGATVSRALRAAAQAGVGSAELASLYDTLSDRAPRSTIIGLLAEVGDRTATDKLLSIARADTDATLRRAAIQRLGSSSDPRVREALAGLVGGGEK